MVNTSDLLQVSQTESIKEAIIDLYLAIKIRSTEELDGIDDD